MVTGNPLTPKPLPGTEDLPLAEQKRRRAIKAEENATRSARTLYALQQQVHTIQEELRKCRKEDLIGAKKVNYDREGIPIFLIKYVLRIVIRPLLVLSFLN